MPNMEAVTVARIFVNEFICCFGIPEQLHTDQGRNFESTIVKEMCKMLGIIKTGTTPYHPKSDGMIERFNRTVLNMLSKVVSNDEQGWDLHLLTFMLAYRTSRQQGLPLLVWCMGEKQSFLRTLFSTYLMLKKLLINMAML